MKKNRVPKSLQASPALIAFSKTGDKLGTYLDWLDSTGRLTSEESLKLFSLINDHIDSAIAYGHNPKNR